jgi:2-iminobutanoate/2-iminopropanoate deaminase
MKAISTTAAPAPAGHYSQAIVHGGIAYVSGQVPAHPDDRMRFKNAPIDAQARQVFANLDAVLAACGSSRADVLRTTIYITDIALWGTVNEIYAGFFGEHRPARTVVPSNPLRDGFLIEIDAIAKLSESAG